MLASILCFTMISAITNNGDGHINGVGNKVSNHFGASNSGNVQSGVYNTDIGQGNVNGDGQNVVNGQSVTPGSSATPQSDDKWAGFGNAVKNRVRAKMNDMGGVFDDNSGE